MVCPEFTIERVFSYGFHSNTRVQQIPGNAKETIASHYYFRFFIEDSEGGPVIDGVHYPAAKGYFSLCKPLQRRRFINPFRCYLLDISTEDPLLVEALNRLPTYAYHPEMDRILELHKKMINLASETTLDGRLELSTYACELLRLLLHHQPEYAIEYTHDSKPRRHQEALLSALNYLKEHLEEDVDLEKLAQISHLHPTYFHKLFKTAFNSTPAQQLMSYRIAKAREYLREDKHSIAEISRMCGFSSQSYFCRKFKMSSKSTPSKYRETYCKKRKK